MNLKKAVGYRWLANWPIIGKVILRKIDIAMLLELQEIEARFALPSVRFVNQINDLYDCLKELQRPLQIDMSLFHDYVLAINTSSSRTISGLFERIADNEGLDLEEHFSKSGSRVSKFLDWYSNEESVNYFINNTYTLVELYCSRNKRKDDPRELKPIKCNEATERLLNSRWFRVLVNDLIQVLVVILSQRTGG